MELLIMENSMAVTQKINHWINICSNNPASGYSKVSKRYVHIHVPCSIILNSLMVEETQMSTNRRLDKENVVYECKGILHSIKKEEYPVTCYNMDIMLSKIEQSEKFKYCMIILIWII